MYKITPSDQTSGNWSVTLVLIFHLASHSSRNLPTAGASYESPNRISGAEYAKLPHDVSNFWPGLNLLLKPKSVNLTIPNFSKNSTFSGFRSLFKQKGAKKQFSYVRSQNAFQRIEMKLTDAQRAIYDNKKWLGQFVENIL